MLSVACKARSLLIGQEDAETVSNSLTGPEAACAAAHTAGVVAITSKRSDALQFLLTPAMRVW